MCDRKIVEVNNMKQSPKLLVIFFVTIVTISFGYIRLSSSDAAPVSPKDADLKVVQAPPMSKPQARTPYTEPTFGASVVRVTDAKSDVSGGDTSVGMKNEYSRVQSFNVNDTYIVVRSINAYWYLYDANTLKPIRQLPFQGEVEPRWDANDPNRLYYVDDKKLVAYNVTSKQSNVVHDFSKDVPSNTAFVWTKGEGSPSMDGRYWGFMADDPNGKPLALLIYDLAQNKVIAKRNVPSNAPDYDHATISPMGGYLFAGYDAYYDRTLTKETPLSSVGHGDLALDAQGREVMVYQDTKTDSISMLDLATGKVTVLFTIDFSKHSKGFHISGHAFKKRGWALISCFIEGNYPSSDWMDNTIFAVELRPKGRIIRIAHHHSLYNPRVEHDYWAEPHATVNRDFTRVLFTSNWGKTGTEQVEMYMIKLPENWIW